MSIRSYIRRGIRYVLSGQPVIEVPAQISYSAPDKKLYGRKILVTGGGRGLGFAMAKRFIEEGASVLIAGRSESTLKKAADELGCKYAVADVSDSGCWEKLIDECINSLGGLDTLVNNAGISLHEGNFMNVTPDDFDKQFNSNLRGGYFLTQTFLKKTDASHRRNVLFISSERGFQSDDLPYGLTKVAINSLVKGLAYRFLKENVRVNGVAPGVTSSDMTGVAKDGNLYYPYNSNNRAYLPEEVAEVAAFLISDVSSCVSGEIIQCNEAKTVNAHWR